MEDTTADNDDTATGTGAEPAAEDQRRPAAEPETDWKSEAEKWKALARRHEERRQVDGWLNPDDAKSLSSERDELRTAAADADSIRIEAAQNLAMAKLEAQLARAGLDDDDIEALTTALDPTRLLADGAPSPEAIKKVAGVLTKRAGASPDPDQGAGRKSGPSTPSMSDLMRAGAGRGGS